MEYLILTGFTMLILAILLVAAYTKISGSEKQVDIDSAEKAVNRIKEAVDFAYIHGYPTKLTISVYLPPDLDGARSFIDNRTINLAINVGKEYTDVWRSTKGEIGWDVYREPPSEFPTSEGYYVFIVESTPYADFGGPNSSGMVNIHE